MGEGSAPSPCRNTVSAPRTPIAFDPITAAATGARFCLVRGLPVELSQSLNRSGLSLITRCDDDGTAVPVALRPTATFLVETFRCFVSFSTVAGLAPASPGSFFVFLLPPWGEALSGSLGCGPCGPFGLVGRRHGPA